jgi:CRP-like cAMP-binding protein
MPVTARLSQKFYERLGEDLAQELVDWFNAVDATYRADLRELNELNFQRFDAKVEQRFAEADAKLERRFAQADVKLEQRFAQADAKLAALRNEIRTDLSDRHMSLLRWMFGFWIATLLAVLGLYVR